ncbi:MAG: DUF3137 domain-containing protein [Bacilli bacterium]
MTFEGFQDELKRDPYTASKISFLKKDPSVLSAKKEYNSPKNIFLLVFSFFPLALSIVVAILIIYFTKNYSIIALGIVLVAFGIIVTIPFFMSFQKIRVRSLSNIIGQKVTEIIYGENAVYHAYKGFPLSYLTSLGLFQVNTIYQENYIEGTYHGINCSGSYITSSHKTEIDDPTSTIIDFKGVVISLKNTIPCDSHIIVSQKTDVPNNKSFNSLNEKFVSSFTTKCDDKEYSNTFLSEEKIKNLFLVTENEDSIFKFLFRNNEMVILIPTVIEPLNIKNSLSPDRLIDYFLRMTTMTAYYIEKMKLYQTKNKD